ncbi:MAG TPA: RNA-binding protein [Candidatus Saccharimonadia bacterium]|nr:RNA-binding protein [Candidatus Saccharimonadia bacterium]
MAVKLFVGSLSFSIDDDQLKELFVPFGTVVSATIIMDRDTNRSKGFGFVEMSTDDEAQAAIKSLNGQTVGGRAIAVNIAKPKKDFGDRGDRPAYGRDRRY